MTYDFFFKNILIFTVLFLFVFFIVIIEVYDLLESKHIISARDSLTLLNNAKAVIIDLRSEILFKKCHIINSVNLPFNILIRNIGLLNKYKGKIIIFVHDSNKEIKKIFKVIKTDDNLNIKYFKDGIKEWLNNDFPTKSDKKFY